jgi:hypothetical protein
MRSFEQVQHDCVIGNAIQWSASDAFCDIGDLRFDAWIEHCSFG